MLRTLSQVVAVLLIVLSSGACGEQPPVPSVTSQGGQSAAMPVEMTLKQRSTRALPGMHGRVLLTLDDITRNQVLVSLATDKGKPLLPPRSMSPDEVVFFQWGETRYGLTLKELHDTLLGEDFGTFVISVPRKRVGLREDEKIEQLIQQVAELQQAVFIRNGVEHDAKEAANHLRSKWRAKADEVKTAEQFIELLASRSSISGRPYKIRFPDGRVVEAGKYLHQQLRKLEDASRPAGAESSASPARETPSPDQSPSGH